MLETLLTAFSSGHSSIRDAHRDVRPGTVRPRAVERVAGQRIRQCLNAWDDAHPHEDPRGDRNAPLADVRHSRPHLAAARTTARR